MGKSAVAEKFSNEPLSAPLKLQFDYTRSVGPTIGAFVTALRDRKVIGARGSDGRVYVPPPEFDPDTAEPLTDFVGVSDAGTVVSWTWMPEPIAGQPLTTPFAWALIKLDGADTSLAHAVDVDSPAGMSTGMRVRARWVTDRVGRIQDIVCFEPGESTNEPGPSTESDPVTMVTTPIDLDYLHSASAEESYYLRGLKAGRLIGGRTGPGGKVYIPPRSANPTDGIPTKEQVELPDRGIVTTFCIVNVPFLGQRIKPPYVAAYVLLDGADIAFLHLILDCDAADVRMGMRVEAKWKPREEWGYTLENIEYFRPTGEPDAEYDTYKHHL
ncbi:MULTISPECIES: Zn-ribbon domain-containing OB-fold protein [unclassified Rhodococcus (in: high G+C Gram-positive bacteria)]|uniref:Zn-ribbon domain-containing OB-fold protein n=1 Tax=unclassified Rhodococcus (in: high G+C Gram-positive bacteria) TaxID=192944 RepID=UPI00163986F9|nr:MULTISPECIES: OB-fold nucleic acid binding domain-containing protein [unclassified Rhodococcus (in: high G+C Gram-positive bacteria)]MBC2642259.1 OB-fold domain-containing protein [Rhodococcus sp. 3A]MBC2892998.1 OB-fold domain-containing protein [Rhodococcus sp. 4CII]